MWRRYLYIVALILVVFVLGRLSCYFYPSKNVGEKQYGQDFSENIFEVEGQIKGSARGTVIEKEDDFFVLLPKNKTKTIVVKPSPVTLFWLSPDPEIEKETWNKISTRELKIMDILQQTDYVALEVGDEVYVYFGIEDGKSSPEQVSIFK